MFIPVKAKGTKQQQVEEQLDAFSTLPVITLCANPKKGSKMLRLNRKAVEVLDLKVNSDKDRLAIIRGYESENTSEEKMFVYLTDQENYEYINEKRNEVKRMSSKVNLSTLRFKSVWMYDDMEDFHSDENFLEDRHFILVPSVEGYFKLDEITANTFDSNIIVKEIEVEEKEIDSTFESKGVDAEVSIN